jgi:hypothetical protein
MALLQKRVNFNHRIGSLVLKLNRKTRFNWRVITYRQAVSLELTDEKSPDRCKAFIDHPRAVDNY